MRELFHVPNNYFLSHSVGCLPKDTPEFVREQFFDPWQTSGGNAWDNWLEIVDSFRDNIAEYLGVERNNICPQTNISSALTKVLYSLPKREGRNVIVLSEKDYPTIGFVFDRAKTAGYVLRFVEGDIADPDVWADAIDDQTAIVHITHAISNTSQLLPVERICELARAANAVSIVDAAQSVGIVETPTKTWGADFVLGTSVKFLCGGPGACFLSATNEILEVCKPVDVGWFSHEFPFEGDIKRFVYANDATKFMGGTPSPEPLAAAINGMNTLKQSNSLDTDKRVQNLLDRLSDAVPDELLVSPRNSQNRGGTLVVKPSDPDLFQSVLNEHKIFCDTRTDGFRFSVHGYTRESEVDLLRDILQKAT